jgi:hypothetical protein
MCSDLGYDEALLLRTYCFPVCIDVSRKFFAFAVIGYFLCCFSLLGYFPFIFERTVVADCI